MAAHNTPDDMRVTVLSSLPPQKGITPYTVHLLEALATVEGLRAEALGFRSLYPRFAYPGGAPDANAPAAELPVRARRPLAWYSPLSWVRAGAGVRSEVLHVQWWSWVLAPPTAVVMLLARLRGKRVVVTAHNVAPHERGRVKRWLNAAVLRLAHHIIVHAERNRTELIAQGFDAVAISVVPMGAQRMPGIAAGSGRRERARSTLRIERDARVVLLFGNLRPYKGVDVLLRAAALARGRVAGIQVIIAGALWKDCPDPRDLARGLGIDDAVILRTEYVPDDNVPALFDAADVVVFPYVHFDGQSAAAALALSSGRAMIVSDVGGLPELVRDGRAIVPAGDGVALADALAAVLLDDGLRAKLEADAELVRAGLSWSDIGARTADVYRRVLGRTAPPIADEPSRELRAA